MTAHAGVKTEAAVQREESEAAERLGKIIAPYCFFGNFLDTEDPTRCYYENKLEFVEEASRYIAEHPGSELSEALSYRGRLYRLSSGETKYSEEPVSWAFTDSLFLEWEGSSLKLTRIVADTKEGTGISIQGLALFLKAKGYDIHDIEYWTGTSPEKYFEEHPLAERIATVWDWEEEVLFPMRKDCILPIS